MRRRHENYFSLLGRQRVPLRSQTTTDLHGTDALVLSLDPRAVLQTVEDVGGSRLLGERGRHRGGAEGVVLFLARRTVFPRLEVYIPTREEKARGKYQRSSRLAV